MLKSRIKPSFVNFLVSFYFLFIYLFIYLFIFFFGWGNPAGGGGGGQKTRQIFVSESSNKN